MSKSAELTFYRGQPNPASGQGRALYLLRGDATAPNVEISVAKGVVLPEGRGKPASPFHLKVLHFNDLHGWISDIQHQGTRPIFSRMIHEIGAIRSSCAQREDHGLIVVSAGDDIIGTLFDQLLSERPEGASAHAGYRLYSQAGVDATCLGNHDLDLGFDPICSAIKRDAAFPVLAANLKTPVPLTSPCLPAVLYVIKGVRVGLLGLTTSAERNLLAKEEFQITDPVEVASRLVPRLKPFCDVLIVLSHLGFSLTSGSPAVQLAGDVELAEALPRGSVDLIVGGHTHHVLNEKGMEAHNIVNGIPIVQAGMLGRFLGLVDITVEEQAAVTNARLIPTETLPVAESFEHSYVKPLLDQVMPICDTPIGVASQHPDVTMDAVRNSFATKESAFANFICDALVSRLQAGGIRVNLAFLDSSSVRTGLPAGGEVSYGDWFNIMPFADTIWILKLTGRQLLTLVTDNALRVDRPGCPHTERGFLHFSRALRYRISLGSSRASAQALDITYEGVPLERSLDEVFRVACSSFFRVSAASWEAIKRDHLPLTDLDLHRLPKETTGLIMRREIVGYIRGHGGVTAQSGVQLDGRLVVQ